MSKKARKTRKMVGGFNPTFLVTVLLFCSLLFHYYHLDDKNKRFNELVTKLTEYSESDGIISFNLNSQIKNMMDDKEFNAVLLKMSVRPVELEKPSIADVASDLSVKNYHSLSSSNTMMLKNFKDDLLELPSPIRERMKTKFLKACGEFFGTHPHIYKELDKIILPENANLANILKIIATVFAVNP